MSKQDTFKKVVTPLASALGAAVVTSAMLAPMAFASENPFAATELSSGYNLASKDAEGKCGEGKCGTEAAAKKAGHEGKCGEDKKGENEGKCGASKKADAEGKCGEAKKADAEGKCGAK